MVKVKKNKKKTKKVRNKLNKKTKNKKPDKKVKEVMDRLKRVIDPEVALDVVELGLIYGVEVNKDNVKIKMTLTTPGCPLGHMIIRSVNEVVKKIKWVKNVDVELVFDPPWTTDMMSEEAKKKLGFD